MSQLRKGGPFLDDPTDFDRWVNDNAGANPLIFGNAAGGGSSNVAATASWARMDDIGVKLSSAYSAYSGGSGMKTLLDVTSGGALLSGVLSPAIANAGDTIYIEFTIDSVVYTLTYAPGTVGYRVYIGTLYNQALLSTTLALAATLGGLVATKTHMIAASTNMVIPPTHVVRGLGGPVLKAFKTLKVRVGVTTAQATTTAAECYSGVVYTAR